jgi:hypothetical protein
MSQTDLSAIQATAKTNNGPLDVTGSLFYNGGWFLQVLEGPASTLDKLYKKIELDPGTKIRGYFTTSRQTSVRFRAGA